MNLLRSRLSIEDFIQEMARVSPLNLQLDQLQDWVAHLDVTDDRIQQCIGFQRERYSRKLVCRTARFDLLVLGWLPGQCSPIHDHADSLNVTRVCQGILTSWEFERCPMLTQTKEEWLTQDQLIAVDRHQIHQIANTAERPLVTLHVYARPLRSIQVYCPQSGQAQRVAVTDDLDSTTLAATTAGEQ